MENVILHLIGFPGTGKRTIATEICTQKAFRLIDNQLVNHPIFSVIKLDGKTKLPPNKPPKLSYLTREQF